MPNFLKTKAEYDALLESSKDKLVVIDFTASWCPPCRQIAPLFEKLAGETPSVLFAKVDVDENEAAAQAAGIECMPTFIFYKDGKAIDKLEGADFKGVESRVKQHA